MKLVTPSTLLVIAILSGFGLKAQFLPERGEWLHFSFSHLTLLNKPDQLEESWKSNGWQLMLMGESLFSQRSHWGVGYGIGFSSNYWHTNLNITSVPNAGNVRYTYLPADSVYRSNRFSASYIDVPLEFRFRSKSNRYGRYFRFYVGGLIGYRIGSFSAFKTDDYSVKYFKQDVLSQWHYGVFARTGWYVFNLYAYYGLNPVFSKNDSAPQGIDQMKSLSLGLSISF